ncbi:MAG TPA: 4-alpha-glucanotransferase [Erysipelotrichaceae bacterium]|nr:4-alpha-glucanotransferase [Erysipelotrichaceae bacterium]
MDKRRKFGVLLPVSALPSNHGVGDFSQHAYNFIDWLKEKKYHFWQILPLNPIGPGHSPYVTICSEAIDIRYISLETLVDKKLLKSVPNFQKNSQSINYDDVLAFKEKYLRKAFKNLKNKPYGLEKFKRENPWAEQYAQYLVLKKINDGKPWNKWIIKHLPPCKKEEINYHVWCQFIAYDAWIKILKYANKNDVQIIADCPFYVGLDSVDCYLHKDQFALDENNEPTLVSGCPPDAFSDVGQLWGTPIYDFGKMKEDNYSFLINRILHLAKHCNYLRLDHFRAFDTYFVIPAEDKNTFRGQWLIGPRTDFFDRLFSKNPSIKIIAEDLGILFDSVHELRDHYNFPGMRVIQFIIFDEADDNDNFILYPGTHDNQTLFGWLNSLSEEKINFLEEKFHHPKDLYGALFEYIWNAPSFITVFPLQDLLKLGDEARINNPGTIGKPNWCFKLKDMSWKNKIKYGNK